MNARISGSIVALPALLALLALPVGAATCSTLNFVQGACDTPCVHKEGTSSFTCYACVVDGSQLATASIDMATCTNCDVAVAVDSDGTAALYCADLAVEFKMKKPVKDPTIANTTQSNIKVLVPLSYSFTIGGTSYDSDRVTSGSGQDITYTLSDDFQTAGYRFQGIRVLWTPPGEPASALGTSISKDGLSITLTDNGTLAGGYVFLFELTNTNDTGKDKGTIYLSPDPTIYNPPDTSPGGGAAN